MTRLGLIGRGRWGRNIERTLLSQPDVSVIAIGRNDTPPTHLDGVLIATPNSTHAAIAMPFIEAGVPTFIEKPMATSIADAERMREAAKRTRTPVFVGHLHLYNPAFIALLNVQRGLGAVRFIHCESANDLPRTDSSVLWDWLPHDLSMTNAIFGANPDSVQAWSLTDTGMPQAAASRFHYGPASVVSTMSWLSPVRRQRMTVCAERGTLVFDDKAERKLVLYGEGGAVTYPGYANELPLTRELQSFLQMVRSGVADDAHITLGVAIVRAIAATEDSIARSGATTEIRAARS